MTVLKIVVAAVVTFGLMRLVLGEEMWDLLAVVMVVIGISLAIGAVALLWAWALS